VCVCVHACVCDCVVCMATSCCSFSVNFPLFFRTKQLVIDLLRVQPGENLAEIIYTPATPEQEEVHQMSIRKREQENYTTSLTLDFCFKCWLQFKK